MFQQLEDIGDDDPFAIPLKNVTSQILVKVLEYAEHHKDDLQSITNESDYTPKTSDISEDWYTTF